MILQSLAESGRSLAELAGDLPPVAMVKSKFPAEDPPDPETLARALGALGEGEIDRRDGVKWTGPDAWVHVRPSNTEPVVRIIAEAQDEGAAVDLIERVQAGLA
jgi:phosphomannomutase